MPGVVISDMSTDMVQSLSGTAKDLVQSLILNLASSAGDIFLLLSILFSTFILYE